MHFSALGSWQCTGIDESALPSRERTEIMGVHWVFHDGSASCIPVHSHPSLRTPMIQVHHGRTLGCARVHSHDESALRYMTVHLDHGSD